MENEQQNNSSEKINNHKDKKWLILIALIFTLLVLGSLYFTGYFKKGIIEEKPNHIISTSTKETNDKNNVAKKDLVDDWQFDNQEEYEDALNASFGLGSVSSGLMNAAPASDSIGLATGGAKDINNFRENIKHGYLPLPTDITYEGLFYDYYFDTGITQECTKLFCPSYSSAVSLDPISEEKEYYLSVGLNSGIQESDFKRKNLNLVVVLDISGSMSSSFDKYYYDTITGKRMLSDGSSEEYVEREIKTKIEVASESLVALIDQLEPNDRLGVVLFDNDSYLAKPLNLVAETDIQAIKDHILEIASQGSTNMSAGMNTAIDQYNDYLDINKDEYENRIIFLTDAMPNLGDTSEDGLFGLSETNAKNGIYSTFIGIGVDFNTELINKISKIQGANYYSVHSEQEFKTRLADEFEYMVTPLVFDLKLTLESNDFEIEEVYGSPEANEATGEIMKVNTLFPSATKEGETKGGLVILKLNKIGEGNDIKLKTSYLNREKVEGGSEASFQINNEPHYYNNGVRKGIVLSRYADLMKNWIIDEREGVEENLPPIYYRVNSIEGIMLPPPIETLGQWERTSVSLSINSHYANMFKEFLNYYNKEIETISDSDMNQEVLIMEKLISILSGEKNDTGLNVDEVKELLIGYGFNEDQLQELSDEDLLEAYRQNFID